MKKWYVAYVLSRHEKKTAERLTKMGIENFLPVQEEIRQWAHRRQKVTRVVIPMMIFDWRYILIGLAVSPVYAFCWTLYEKEPWLRPHLSWLNAPTKWAEIICGGIVFAGCYLLKWGN